MNFSHDAPLAPTREAVAAEEVRVEPTTSQLRQVFSATTKSLEASLEAIRGGQTHAGMKGSGVEQDVRDFLRKHLPDSIGITSGQIVDVTGEISPQVDVILFDAARTPRIFVAPDDNHTLPAEGVVACIEVKTHLTMGLLRECVTSAGTIKRLQRTAYIGRPLEVTHHAYGQEWRDILIYCSVLALEADNLYSEAINKLICDMPLHQRLDSVCCLGRGVTLGAQVAAPGAGVALSYAPRATPQSRLVDIPTNDALLMWFLHLAGEVMSADTRPINLSAYAGQVLNHQLALKCDSPTGAYFEEQILRQKDQIFGFSPGTIGALWGARKKAERRAAVSPAENAAALRSIAAILTHGGTMTVDPSLRVGLKALGGYHADLELPVDHQFTAREVDPQVLLQVADIVSKASSNEDPG